MSSLFLRDIIILRKERSMLFAATVAATISASLTLFFHAVFFGAYYLLGYQNARWAIFVAFALVGLVAGSFGGFPIPLGEIDTFNAALTGSVPLAAYALMLGLGVLLYALSFFLSVFAYNRKEF